MMHNVLINLTKKFQIIISFYKSLFVLAIFKMIYLGVGPTFQLAGCIRTERSVKKAGSSLSAFFGFATITDV